MYTLQTTAYLRLGVRPRVLPEDVLQLDIPVHHVVFVTVAYGVNDFLRRLGSLSRVRKHFDEGTARGGGDGDGDRSDRRVTPARNGETR